MIDGYIILNRRTKLIMNLFIFNIGIIVAFVIWGINTFYYQSYFYIHSKILNFNSYYLLEVLIPEKEVNQIIKEDKLLIGDSVYSYAVSDVGNDIIYQNNTNYFQVYLEVFELDDIYKINNYRLEIRIPKEKKRIINYFME